MIDEYERMLSGINVDELISCTNGYIDSENCTWYHKNWTFLRRLGLVSNPFWHEQFFSDQLKAHYKRNTKILVLGTADFSMPLLCSQSGVGQIDICDICKTPLNICDKIAKQERMDWRTFVCDIRKGIGNCYDIIINDAFLTRFTYSEKPVILQNIKQSLVGGGVYITTIRNDWNLGQAVVPSSEQKSLFVEKAKRSAMLKGVDVNRAANAASVYIDHMLSYPIESECALLKMSRSILDIIQCNTIDVPGETVETRYFQAVFRNNF